MRRGAPIYSQQYRKPAVMADYDEDLEGGSGSGTTQRAPNSGSGLQPMEVGLSGGSGGTASTFDSTGKAKRRTYHQGYQSLLVGAAGSMSNDLLQKVLGLLVIVVLAGAMVFPLQMKILWLVYGAVVFGAVVSMWLSKNVLSCDDGTPEMRAGVYNVSSFRVGCVLGFFFAHMSSLHVFITHQLLDCGGAL